MDLIPTLGTYVLVYIWFIGTPYEKVVTETEEIYSEELCDARAEELIHKWKRKDLGIVCKFVPGIPV